MNDQQGVADAVANGHGAFVNNTVVLASFRLPGPRHWISIVYYIRCSRNWLHKFTDGPCVWLPGPVLSTWT